MYSTFLGNYDDAQNLSLSARIDDGSLIFVDTSTVLSRQAHPENESLRPVWDVLNNHLTNTRQSNPALDDLVLILDDITTLDWVGYPSPDIARFVRAVSSLCAKVSSNQLQCRRAVLK